MKSVSLTVAAIALFAYGCAKPGIVSQDNPRHELISNCGASIAAMVAADVMLQLRLENDIRSGDLPKDLQELAKKRMESHPSSEYIKQALIDVGESGLNYALHRSRPRVANLMAEAKHKHGEDLVLGLEEVLPQLELAAQSDCKNAGYRFTSLRRMSSPTHIVSNETARESSQAAPEINASAYSFSHNHPPEEARAGQINKNDAFLLMSETFENGLREKYGYNREKALIYTCLAFEHLNIEDTINSIYTNKQWMNKDELLSKFKDKIAPKEFEFSEAVKNRDPKIGNTLAKCEKSVKLLIEAENQVEKLNEYISKREPLTRVSLDEIRIDAAQYDNKEVLTEGFGIYAMNMFFIKSTPRDINPILVEISKLSRDDRREIVKRCNRIEQGCKIRIRARVSAGKMQSTLVAHDVSF